MCRYCATLTPDARAAMHDSTGKDRRNLLIREDAAKGIPHKTLAAMYGISRQRISIIVKGAP